MPSDIIERIAEFRIKLSRGQGLFYELRNAVLISASLKVILQLSISQAIFLTVICLITFYIVGAVDLRYFKLYQKEEELRSSKYNPHLSKIDKLIK